MKALALLVFRGWLIVACVAFNTRQIAVLDYRMAFITGVVLSCVWWGNSKVAAHSEARGARYAYALGAGLGTLTGMWLGR